MGVKKLSPLCFRLGLAISTRHGSKESEDFLVSGGGKKKKNFTLFSERKERFKGGRRSSARGVRLGVGEMEGGE